MTPDAPLCSVIVPLFRHEQYIEKCLDSVFDQTWGPLELILIDDCSPDAGFDLACSKLGSLAYQDRFQCITVERKAINAGAHDSINCGMALANGRYVAILNSDDEFHPMRLERMIGQMQTHGRRLAYSDVEAFAEQPMPPHRGFTNMLGFCEHVIPSLPSRSFAYLRHNCALTTGNFVIESDFARQLGPFIDLKLAHDWDYLLRATVHEEPLHIPERLYRYRLHDSNTFNEVESRAHVESEVCITRYFSQLTRVPPPNPLAPNPWHWPGVFEHFLRQWGWENLWQRVAHGYAPSGRTERRRANTLLLGS